MLLNNLILLILCLLLVPVGIYAIALPIYPFVVLYNKRRLQSHIDLMGTRFTLKQIKRFIFAICAITEVVVLYVAALLIYFASLVA